MTSAQENYIKYRIERSSEIFKDAELLATNERWRSCVNRLYYTCFHLVSALLFQDDISTKSHDGLKTKFLQLYIKNNKIEIEYGKLYSRLIDWRQESDYSLYVDFDEKDILPLLDEVGKFNAVIIEIINSRR